MGNRPGSFQENIWTKNFSLMMVVAFLMGVANNMFVGTLPLYVMHHGGDSSLSGIVMSVFTLSALCCRHFWGRMLDKEGRKKVLVIGGIIFTLISVVYNFATTVVLIITIRLIHGIGYGAHSTASGTIVSDVIPKSRLSEGIGYYGISSTLATAVGPALGLYISENYSFAMLFNTICLLSIFSLIGSFFINYEKTIENEVPSFDNAADTPALGKMEVKAAKTGRFIEPSAVPASIVTMFVTISMSGIFSFLSAFGMARGISNIGMFFTVYACAILAARLIIGKLSRRMETTRLLLTAMLLAFLALIFLSFAPSLPFVLFSAVLYGFGMGIILPVMNSILIRQCPADKRGAANATYYSAMDIGFTLGPVVFGVILEFTGFTMVYIASAITILFSLLSYMSLVRVKLGEGS